MAMLLEEIPDLKAGGDRAGRAVGRAVANTLINLYVPVLGTMAGGISDMMKTTADYKDEAAGIADALGGFDGWENSAKDRSDYASFYQQYAGEVQAYNQQVVAFNQQQRGLNKDIAGFANDMEVARKFVVAETAKMAAYQQGQEDLRLTDIQRLQKERTETLAYLKTQKDEQTQRRLNKIMGIGQEDQRLPSLPVELPDLTAEPEYDIQSSALFDMTDANTTLSTQILIGLAIGVILLS
jgi:hypothetical protein